MHLSPATQSRISALAVGAVALVALLTALASMQA